MDGFFVAKFKVEKRKKGSAAGNDEAGEDVVVGDAPEEQTGGSAFNDEADKSLIDGESHRVDVIRADVRREQTKASAQDKGNQGRAQVCSQTFYSCADKIRWPDEDAQGEEVDREEETKGLDGSPGPSVSRPIASLSLGCCCTILMYIPCI